MRTPISIQGVFTDADGSPATGTICATPTAPTINGSGYYPAEPICGVFDTSGRIVSQAMLALQLLASDDTGNVPNTVYTFALKLDGQDLVEFNAFVPLASTATDTAVVTVLNSNLVTLSNLKASLAMVGHPITGTNWVGGTTVTAFNAITNVLTLSNPATSTGICSAVVGGAVSITSLIANQV